MDTFTAMLRQLEAPTAKYAELNNAYAGDTPLSHVSPEAKRALDGRIDHVSINVQRVLIDALTERLRVVAFDGVDIWDEWVRMDMQAKQQLLLREALILGRSYAFTWTRDGLPSVSVESATNMTHIEDPVTGEVEIALKRYADGDKSVVILLDREEGRRYEAPKTAWSASGSYRLVEKWSMPGFVPVVPLENRSRVAEEPRSEMADVLPLVGALSKLSQDLLVASEFGARPRRYATGIALVEDDEGNFVSPISDGDRMMTAEEADARFGQLPGADLAGYANAIDIVWRQIVAVTGLPQHLLGAAGTANPATADSVRASEGSLTARSESKQRIFGPDFELLAAHIVAARDGLPLDVQAPRVRWADPATRSQAAEADAATKLFQTGLVSRSEALRRMGYTETQIDQVRAEMRAEALDTAGLDLGALRITDDA